MIESNERNKPHREYGGERDMERFWHVAGNLRSEPLRQRWLIPVLLILVAVSIPWYLPAGAIGRLIFGLPLWVWVPLVCTAGISTLTALAALRFWKDDE